MNGLPKSPAAWKRLQPTSLRNALELCKEHARVAHNRSVERVAELMGVTDHWTLYKWLSSGRMPLSLVRPFEAACGGVDYVTRWLAASNGKLLVDIPTGRRSDAADIQALQERLNTAVGELLRCYAGQASVPDTLAALQAGMEGLAWHRENITKTAEPELELA